MGKKKSNGESAGFTDAEKAAMKERARELKAEKSGTKKGASKGEENLLAKIADMPEDERVMATRLHEIITATAPELKPKTWYGMPAYANKDGKVVCFFQSASKFNSRYATLGFSDNANLDDGAMWATSFALLQLTDVEEKKVIELVKAAIS